ncbi:hypothetical protein DBIPINDM_003626 [Mesorhizobium sp. AR02]|uniref:hypothetical protein n=1 Tax=Mesorhizobium sp. AR02 TaxID=2865837 RepID=UPI00215E7FEE|nr:hypothetical protein [Mesorhizobium sp. AR02]UVK50462.1 hypothetical protein DBIPINDM_003626 [Mesorhizobium sp. AR02]
MSLLELQTNTTDAALLSAAPPIEALPHPSRVTLSQRRLHILPRLQGGRKADQINMGPWLLDGGGVEIVGIPISPAILLLVPLSSSFRWQGGPQLCTGTIRLSIAVAIFLAPLASRDRILSG